jgi:hypothetical protein
MHGSRKKNAGRGKGKITGVRVRGGNVHAIDGDDRQLQQQQGLVYQFHDPASSNMLSAPKKRSLKLEISWIYHVFWPKNNAICQCGLQAGDMLTLLSLMFVDGKRSVA